MADVDRELGLAERFAQLHADRARSWPPAQLAQNVAQRQALLDAFDPEQVVRPGDTIEYFELLDSRGGALTLDGLVASGPAVLIFFRFADCPADNLALPYYDRQLATELAAAGVPLVAISPQIPDRLEAIRHRHELRLTVASDPDNRLARRLGLTFTSLETPSPPPSGWIGEVTGTKSWELPQTAVLILDAGRVVRFAAISPDWLDRIEAPEIRAALGRIGIAIGEVPALAPTER